MLVLEIQDYLKQKESDSDVIAKKKELRKKRTLEERYAACKKERDQLASICEAQLNYIEELQDKIADYESGIAGFLRSNSHRNTLQYGAHHI